MSSRCFHVVSRPPVLLSCCLGKHEKIIIFVFFYSIFTVRSRFVTWATTKENNSDSIQLNFIMQRIVCGLKLVGTHRYHESIMNVNLVAVEARKKQQTIENVYAVLFEFNFVYELNIRERIVAIQRQRFRESSERVVDVWELMRALLWRSFVEWIHLNARTKQFLYNLFHFIPHHTRAWCGFIEFRFQVLHFIHHVVLIKY